LRRHETTQTLLWARKVKGRRRGCRCGDEESGLDIVGGDDDEIGAVNAGIEERAFLLGVIHDAGSFSIST